MSEIKGMLMDRERPAGTGWCGAENCLHASHQNFNESAKPIKKKKAAHK